MRTQTTARGFPNCGEWISSYVKYFKYPYISESGGRLIIAGLGSNRIFGNSAVNQKAIPSIETTINARKEESRNGKK